MGCHPAIHNVYKLRYHNMLPGLEVKRFSYELLYSMGCCIAWDYSVVLPLSLLCTVDIMCYTQKCKPIHAVIKMQMIGNLSLVTQPSLDTEY